MTEAPSPAPPAPEERPRVGLTRWQWGLTIFGLVVPAVVFGIQFALGSDEAWPDLGRGLGFFALWWSAFFGTDLLTQVLSRSAVEQDAAADTPTGPPVQRRPDNDKTLDASVEAITSLIDRMDAAIDRMEKTAALVPGALGLVATVSVARLNTEISGLPLYVGALAASFAFGAVVNATRCLASYRFTGISGYGELWRVDRDYDAFQVGRLNVLSRLLVFTHHAAAQKRTHLRLALVHTALAVALVYAFALVGGFTPPASN